MEKKEITEKPTMEKYGYHSQSGFDDQPSGWMFEGGEEAYYEALKKWEEAQSDNPADAKGVSADITGPELYEWAKTQMQYDRHLEIVGKEKADTVLHFWVKGYQERDRELAEARQVAIDLQTAAESLQHHVERRDERIREIEARNEELLLSSTEVLKSSINSSNTIKTLQQSNDKLAEALKEILDLQGVDGYKLKEIANTALASHDKMKGGGE